MPLKTTAASWCSDAFEVRRRPGGKRPAPASLRKSPHGETSGGAPWEPQAVLQPVGRQRAYGKSASTLPCVDVGRGAPAAKSILGAPTPKHSLSRQAGVGGRAAATPSAVAGLPSRLPNPLANSRRACLARAAPMAVFMSLFSFGGGRTAGRPRDSIQSSRAQPVLW